MSARSNTYSSMASERVSYLGSPSPWLSAVPLRTVPLWRLDAAGTPSSAAARVRLRAAIPGPPERDAGLPGWAR